MQKLLSLLVLFSSLVAMEQHETNKFLTLKDRIGESRFNQLKKAWQNDLSDLAVQMEHISKRYPWYYYSEDVQAYISYENDSCYIMTIGPASFTHKHLSIESEDFFKALKPALLAKSQKKSCIMS